MASMLRTMRRAIEKPGNHHAKKHNAKEFIVKAEAKKHKKEEPKHE